MLWDAQETEKPICWGNSFLPYAHFDLHETAQGIPQQTLSVWSGELHFVQQLIV